MKNPNTSHAMFRVLRYKTATFSPCGTTHDQFQPLDPHLDLRLPPSSGRWSDVPCVGGIKVKQPDQTNKVKGRDPSNGKNSLQVTIQRKVLRKPARGVVFPRFFL